MDIQACEILVAGGGIGGMAAALALAREGAQVRLLEQAPAFAEVGAGIQIGPNVTRILRQWGLEPGLREVATFPRQLLARDALSGRVLGELPLGQRAEQRYGAPYACIHRADMHALLLRAVQAQGVPLHLNQRVSHVHQQEKQLLVELGTGQRVPARLLVGADGLWSQTRRALGLHTPPRVTGHLAYRGLVALHGPELQDRVTVWMGRHLHVVHYPVQGGRALNVVAIVQGRVPQDVRDWNQAAHAEHLMQALGQVCGELCETLQAVPHWRLWALNDRPPVAGPSEMGQGAVALLGDAAHPMRPYLAQGAGMAIEDAQVLAQCWATQGAVEQRVKRYADLRWQRNARVQARAIRNGDIFHAQGWMQWGRDLLMAKLGPKVMDVPWLYRAGG